MNTEISLDELLDELKTMGLAVHVELAVQRILNRRLQAALDEKEQDG
jgi:hypothetical protein